MPSTLETAAVVVLLRTSAQPPHAIADLIEDAGSAMAALEQVGGANSPAPRLFTYEMTTQELLNQASEDIVRWQARGIRPLTVLDPDYPENLKAVHDRPPLLFINGRLTAGDARTVAVIGTRNPTTHGLLAATKIAIHLARSGYTVASGLARGIDTAAHRAAIASNGRTIGVIATGLTHSYPPENMALQRHLATHSAVVSQFWPEAPPAKRSFPMRNAVMSGLSLGTVIVEASERSGARTQARAALAHNRPVFLHRSLLRQKWAGELSKRPGAHIIGAPEEITTTLEDLHSNTPLIA